MGHFVRILLILPVLLALALPVWAKPPVLVEMFISKNCPACPKAEANLRELAATEPGFMPLVWVVNYWDYVAGPDPLAMPEAVERQRVYADRLSVRGPYTPQVIANGKNHVAGNRIGAFRRLIRTERNIDRPVLVSLRTTPDGIDLVSLSGPLDTEVIVVTVGQTVRNGGVVENVVSDMRHLGSWSGEARHYDVPCASRCIAIVQTRDCGPVFSVAEFGPSVAMAPSPDLAQVVPEQ